ATPCWWLLRSSPGTAAGRSCRPPRPRDGRTPAPWVTSRYAMVMLLVRVMPTAVADIDHAKQLRGRGEVLIVACGYSMMLYAVGFGPRALARPRCTRVPGTGGAGPTARAE